MGTVGVEARGIPGPDFPGCKSMSKWRVSDYCDPEFL